MNHPNAPVSIEGRRRLIERCKTRPIAHVAAEMGISRACASKWVNRYRQFGAVGFADRSSAPRTQPAATSPEFIDLNGETNRESQKIIARRPGHRVHIDVKKVGRIPDGGGWRAHGRGSERAKAAEQSKRKSKRGGYVYLHSAIDGYSGLACTEGLSDEKAVTAIAFMHRARAWFAAHGITRIERIVTDNGACYRAEAFARAALLGSRHQRITPYTPRHNGKVERYNRIISEEFPYTRTWTSEDQRREALGAWNIHDNYHRPHSTAVGEPPASRLPATDCPSRTRSFSVLAIGCGRGKAGRHCAGLPGAGCRVPGVEFACGNVGLADPSASPTLLVRRFPDRASGAGGGIHWSAGRSRRSRGAS
ncbi:IS481 family transposase [Amycolatopsis endophytica]|uniref:Transposase InsO family protein n=1 Tax=Amycolatopsis endophytica TaxID=860233 RepID=A0A853B9T5_9PSEU|nr:transposase InsO family protein [Amycolatopsis endophytica]